jgi:hypothetical protein
MASLIILSLVATAGFSLVATSAQTRKYVVQNTDTLSQAEIAFRRIVENIRSASQAGIVAPSEIDLVTQPDTSQPGNPVYNVKYFLMGSQLIENDDRYGLNVLASNVTTFTPTIVQSTKPTMFQITLTLISPEGDTVTRQSSVTARNF